MVTWAVFWVPPVHGAGRFTIVTCPDPDGLQTSGVTVIVDGVGATVAVGGGVAVGVVGVGVGVGVAVGAEVSTDEATGAADVRPAAATAALPRGPEVTDGRPVARTTPVTRSKQNGTPSPVRIARLNAPRRFGRAISRDFRGTTSIFLTPPVGRDDLAGYE